MCFGSRPWNPRKLQRVLSKGNTGSPDRLNQFLSRDTPTQLGIWRAEIKREKAVQLSIMWFDVMKSGERKVGDAPAPWRALDHQRNLRPASVRALLRGFSVVILARSSNRRRRGQRGFAGTVDSGVFGRPQPGPVLGKWREVGWLSDFFLGNN